MKKIVYIMGAGRSGTTLLDTILGNNPEIFSAGELNRFPKYQGLPLLVETQSETAVFWNEFKSRMPERWSSDKFTSTHQLCHSFEYHSHVLKTWVPFFNDALKKYHDYLNSFFKTLDPMIKESVVVDSSKYPMRGYHLAKALPYEVVFIYLKRNPVDVVRSFAKKGIEQPSQGWFKANIYMVITNFLSLYVLLILGKKHKNITVRYDDLIAEPETVLHTISAALEIDLSKSIQMVRTNEPFKKGLLFDGNRMRLEDSVVLQAAKKKTVPAGLKEKITLILQRFWWP